MSFRVAISKLQLFQKFQVTTYAHVFSDMSHYDQTILTQFQLKFNQQITANEVNYLHMCQSLITYLCPSELLTTTIHFTLQLNQTNSMVTMVTENTEAQPCSK